MQDGGKLFWHFCKMMLRSLSLVGTNWLLFASVLQVFRKEMPFQLPTRLWKLCNRHPDDPAAIFAGPRYSVLKVILGRKGAEIFKQVWDRSPCYIYSTGWERRSFRTTAAAANLPTAIAKLAAMVQLVATGFSYDKFFADRSNRYAFNPVVPELLAVEIDRGNRPMLETIEEIIKGGNNTGLVNRSMILGLLKSHSREAHELVGQLLLAARLQEGLRQTICECIDEGSREGFLYMLGLILEHGLVRYPAIVRALDVWTGLGLAAWKQAAVQKSLELAYRCLNEPEFAASCRCSDNALEIYIGLWALGVAEVHDTETCLKRLLASAEKHKKITALYFLAQTGLPQYQHKLAAPLLAEDDWEVKSWALINIFPGATSAMLRPEHRHWLTTFSSEPSGQLFSQLKDTLDSMPKSKLAYRGSVFSWDRVSVSASEICLKLLMASDRHSVDAVDAMLDYVDRMDAETRAMFIEVFLRSPKTEKQRTTLVRLMGDRSKVVRQAAATQADKFLLGRKDYEIIEGFLQHKDEDLRKSAITLLLAQPPQGVLASSQNLLAVGDEASIQAGLEIIKLAEKKPRFRRIAPQCRQLLAQHATENNGSSQAQTPDREWAAANGFGLFDPRTIQSAPAVKGAGTPPKALLSCSVRELNRILTSLDNLIDEYSDYEYGVEDWQGGRRKVVLGGGPNLLPLKENFGGDMKVEAYPLADVWNQFAARNKLSADKLLDLLFYLKYGDFNRDSSRSLWYILLLHKLFPVKTKVYRHYRQLKYPGHIVNIVAALHNQCPPQQVFALCREVARAVLKNVPRRRFAHNCMATGLAPRSHQFHWIFFDQPEFEFWLSRMRKNVHDDDSFRDSFCIGHELYRRAKFRSHGHLRLADFERAHALGLVTEAELYAELCARPLSPSNLKLLTNQDTHQGKSLSRYAKLSQVGTRVVARLVDIELKRGDMPTAASELAANIFRVSGARYFAEILLAMGEGAYVRGYNFVYEGSTKTQMLSHLLKHCYPAEGEDGTYLRQLLQGKGVREKQLIDGAMYAPQWLGIVEECLGWQGLKSAGWYFHAHVNDVFSAEKEAMVAQFSPFLPRDFNNGAFDVNWFRRAYSALGEERFRLVYDSAKYVARGRLHKRSQLFADAALGKLTVSQVEEVISAKRNQDYVLCYGVIPLAGKEDVLRRYQLLHDFLKAGRKFGAQRRSSEAAAVAAGLANLARNAGFADVERFRWYVETEKFRTIRNCLEPAQVDGVDVWLEIDQAGRARAVAEKAGKRLKGIPTRLNRHSHVSKLKQVQKDLKEQYSRARWSLEKAMVAGDEFGADELATLGDNPVLAPLVQTLVFRCGEHMGFFHNGTLAGMGGSSYVLRPQDKCSIAHPVHLWRSGDWAAYQRHIYERGIVQPFRQVFRELYRPNADELAAGTVSRRYDGHQVQPRKAAALLRSRGWTVDFMLYGQKVWHNLGVSVELFSMADLFSPVEVEAPTLESIQFYDLSARKALAIEDVPAVVFSEAMRDIDLIVSVAHVGGVDPEASLSTIELRQAIISEMLRLLKVGNVSLQGSHARIEGSIGKYTVHLGSGVAHKLASGALHILPVHSQQRGRFFLPFLDDDPKTVEIISKIVLLAEDDKIRDPTVLNQLNP